VVDLSFPTRRAQIFNILPIPQIEGVGSSNKVGFSIGAGQYYNLNCFRASPCGLRVAPPVGLVQCM